MKIYDLLNPHTRALLLLRLARLPCRRHHVSPQFITYLIGREGPGVSPTPPRDHGGYAVGILKIIINMCVNYCTSVAILEKLDHVRYHKVSREMIVTIVSWYSRYRAV